MRIWFKLLLFVAVLPSLLCYQQVYDQGDADAEAMNAFQHYFARFLPERHKSHQYDEHNSLIHEDSPHERLESAIPLKPLVHGMYGNGHSISSGSRQPLANPDDADEDPITSGQSVTEMKQKISQHRVKLTRLKQEEKDLAHEKAFLEKTLELKRGQRTMQDGQVKLSQAELEDKAKEIEMYRREAPRTLCKYNELVRKQKELQQTLNRLHRESDELSTSKNVIMDKIQHLNMEDLIERHARGLPDAMAGALRKSAAALVPFFDYLMIAADTNNRLVDHVGEEIDKYTHVNISQSPFMSGVLFYCVLLIPLLTIVSFVRRLFDSSSKLTVSHYIIFGNVYFVIVCVANVIAALILQDDPVGLMFRKFERTFIIGNLFLSLYYIWHVVMLGLQALYTFEQRNVSQFVATLCVGIHYFLFAWRRVFTDHAPLMYTFNYLVYGTIFAFISYERYNRLSTRQLNDSAIFRAVRLMLKRRHQISSWRGFRLSLSEGWTSFFGKKSNGDRRYSKRQDRYLVGDHHKARYGDTERTRAGQLEDYSSQSDVSEASDLEQPSGRRRNRREKHRRVGNGHPRPRSFIQMFFGSQENADSSDDVDVEGRQESNTWRLLRGTGARGDAAASGTSTAARHGQTSRSHRKRDKKPSRTAQSSLWKWS